MTDETQIQDKEYENPIVAVDPELELKMLKQRADIIGVAYSNNIGLDTLKQRINAKLEGLDAKEPDEVQTGATESSNQVAANPLAETPAADVKARPKSLRQHLIEENMRLVRVRITCMNPAKSTLPGEVFAVANKYVGTVKKFIPFGKGTENGYHIPHILYKFLKRKDFQMVRTIRDRKTGIETPESTWQKEFAIEILPPLTTEELKKLAIAQMASEN